MQGLYVIYLLFRLFFIFNQHMLVDIIILLYYTVESILKIYFLSLNYNLFHFLILFLV